MHIAADMQLVVDEIKKSKKERQEYGKICLLREQERKRTFQDDIHKAKMLWQSLLKPKREIKKRK